MMANLYKISLTLKPKLNRYAALLSTQAQLYESLEPVKLSYASYEGTDTVETPYPLIIMHGLLGSKSNWNSLSKAFHQQSKPKRKVITIDARNHGDSPHSMSHSYAHLAEDLRVLMEDLSIRKASLLGHSMGGRTIMYFALKYPDLVEKLIVADISPVRSSPQLHSMPNLLELMKNVNLPTTGPISSARLNVDQQLAIKVHDRALRSFLLTNLVQASDGQYRWRVNIPALMANFNEHIAQFPKLSGLTFPRPVLFIGGGSSDYILKSDFDAILKLFPDAKLEYLSGAGHWLHSDKPTEFLKMSLEFLNTN